ncbi:CDK5 and ABL1 enzyme substrate 1-like isoform X1 [Ptychodera flava]|uniref:CDK5 and ABL1 enzyme substrate 1-like isoform X1 n=1 Tax=Ptychodera flava TaxID=63121 RepID=UPI00396A3231
MATSGRRRNAKNSKRRSDALLFLSNINLDGSIAVGSMGIKDKASLSREESEDSNVAGTEDDVVDCGDAEQSGERTEIQHVQKRQLQRTRSHSDQASPDNKLSASPRKNRANTFNAGEQTSSGHRRKLFQQLSNEPQSPSPPNANIRYQAMRKRSSSYTDQSNQASSPCQRHDVPISRSFRDGTVKNKRILLVSQRKTPFALFSVQPYSKHSQQGLLKVEALHHVEATGTTRSRKISGTKILSLSDEDFLAHVGTEVNDGLGKAISYSHFLVPTMSKTMARQRAFIEHMGYSSLPQSPDSPVSKKQHPLRSVSFDPRLMVGNNNDKENALGDIHYHYDPNELDDPELRSGKHKTMLTFSSYRVSVIDYTKPSELKKELNDKFREKFPHVQITLSKLRSIKRELKKIAMVQNTLEPATLAMAYVYYEKLVLQKKINKENRKLCAGACLLLAAKLSDIKGVELQHLIKEIEDTFRVKTKDLFNYEFRCLVALQFTLHLPAYEVLPHYKRIIHHT